MQMQTIDEFKIEGFQNFQQYLKTSPINIQITDPEIQPDLSKINALHNEIFCL